MKEKTYKALREVISTAKKYLTVKYGKRKRLSKEELWEKATALRDIKQVESCIDEVEKEY